MFVHTPGSPIHSPGWHHAPLHVLSESGTYFVTAATYLKIHHFRGRDRLSLLQEALLGLTSEFGWQLEAWTVFSNDYHFVAHSPVPETDASSLSRMIGLLHERTAKAVNRADDTPRRHVWHNYWETVLTFERSFLARVSYTHFNAVRHGLVPRPEDYPWCSASWHAAHSTPSQSATLRAFMPTRIRVPDEYDVAPEW